MSLLPISLGGFGQGGTFAAFDDDSNFFGGSSKCKEGKAKKGRGKTSSKNKAKKEAENQEKAYTKGRLDDIFSRRKEESQLSMFTSGTASVIGSVASAEPSHQKLEEKVRRRREQRRRGRSKDPESTNTTEAARGAVRRTSSRRTLSVSRSSRSPSVATRRGRGYQRSQSGTCLTPPPLDENNAHLR